MSNVDLGPALRMAVIRLARRLRLEDTATGSTISQLSALAVVHRHGPITLRDLANKERVQPPTMTRLVTHLEDDGLVSRSGHPDDGRVVLVEITALGNTVLADSRQRRTAFLVAHLAELSEDERQLLQRAIPILERLAEQ